MRAKPVTRASTFPKIVRQSSQTRQVTWSSRQRTGPEDGSVSFPEYQGLSYEQASREGARLIAQAQMMGYWVDLPERLDCLRRIMEQVGAYNQAA